MTAPREEWSARYPVIVGSLSLVILLVGFGGWSIYTRIEGAIIAPGIVQVEGLRQVVQHQDGGTVAELSVREGDHVETGFVLMKFDDTSHRNERQIIQTQLDELMARGARLEAERDNLSTVEFPEKLTSRAASDGELLDLLSGQIRLFEARRKTLFEQFAQLDERVDQFNNQIVGLASQIASVELQIRLVQDELTNQETLLGKGLTQASRVAELKREIARLTGRVGELETAKAQASGQIAETNIERLQLESLRREEAITSLRDISISVVELRQRLLTIDEVLSRLELRAPTSGVVYGLQVHTVRAVVRAAEPVLFVVPDNGQLVVQIKVPTVHIDQVHKGQTAILQLSAFDQRTTPVISGTVTKVSPDAFTDETTGAAYYRAEVSPNAEDVEALAHVTLLPGMPVDAFLQTEPRTPMSYFIKPLTDYIAKAFRES